MSIKREPITRLEVSGYKSIKNCRIDFERVNVFIGSNGAGKSNIISVFQFLQNILGKNLQKTIDTNKINSLFYNGKEKDSEIMFEVYFGNLSYGLYLKPTENNKVIIKKEYFTDQNRERNKIIISEESSESSWDIGTGENIDKEIIPILAKQNWRLYHFGDMGCNASIKQKQDISNNKFLTENGENLAAFLYNLKQNYKEYYIEIIETIKLVAPYFQDFILVPDEENQKQIALRWKQIGFRDIFDASEFSDGLLRFICITALLLQPYELLPTTIIIDEPELGLHPFAITILSEMIRQLPEDNQIIISTQSSDVLNEFDVEEVIVIHRDQGKTVCKRLNYQELEIWLDNDYTLAELWKKNILGGRLSK